MAIREEKKDYLYPLLDYSYDFSIILTEVTSSVGAQMLSTHIPRKIQKCDKKIAQSRLHPISKRKRGYFWPKMALNCYKSSIKLAIINRNGSQMNDLS